MVSDSRPSLAVPAGRSPLPRLHDAICGFVWSLSPRVTVVFLVLATAEISVGEITGIWWPDAVAALLRWLTGP